MASAQDRQLHLRRAATRPAHIWVSTLALLFGGAMAWVMVKLAPSTGNDVAAARALGIVSVTTLAGHSKSAESLAYVLGMAGAITTSVGIWFAWALHAGKNSLGDVSLTNRKMPRVTWRELTVVSFLAVICFARLWNGRAASYSAWSVLVEEGEMMAWIDTLLRGGALSRDVFCLYGPLAPWTTQWLMSIFHPSLGLWRTFIFALNAPAIVAAYLLLRGITRTKTAAALGAAAFALICSSAIPAMSWSLLRVGLGFAAIAAMTRALDRGTHGWRLTTGAFIALALLYSQEVGIACAIAVGLTLLFGAKHRWIDIFWTMIGGAVVLAPAVAYLIATHSLAATIDNLILFPRIRVLGFAALPFPHLAPNLQSLRAYFVPAILAVSAFSTATKILRGLRDAWVMAELALFLFGALVFTAALSRPDETHLAFTAAPALMLLALLIESGSVATWLRNQGIVAVSGLIVATAALALWAPLAWQNLRSLLEPPTGRKIDIARGGNALLPDDFARDLSELSRAIQARTAPNEPIWAFPNEALLYFLADRPQATRFPQSLFAVTREQRQQLIVDLERTRPSLTVVYLESPEVDGLAYRDTMPEVLEYLNAHYEREETIGTFALLRRKD